LPLNGPHCTHDPPKARLAVAIAALVSASCYAQYDRGLASANARDWPKAEVEIWRYLEGSDCTNRVPMPDCKRAAVKLGEVLLEDDRPTSAAAVFRFAQTALRGRPLWTPEVDRDLDARIANGLVTAKERWTRFRSGMSGRCQLVARYVGPKNGLQLVALWSDLDMERNESSHAPAGSLVLFEKAATAGPHMITVGATYVDPATPRHHYQTEITHYRACADGERVEIVFTVGEAAIERLELDAVATGGQPVPHEGPLRPPPAGYFGP